MSVVPMKRISVIAMKKDRKAVLEYLQVLGVVEVSFKRKEDEVFRKQDMSAQQRMFEQRAAQAEEALQILKNNAPEKTSIAAALTGRVEMSRQEFDEKLARREEILKECSSVIELDKHLAETVSSIPKLKDQKKALEPWMNFDLPLDLKETRKTAIFTGTLQGEYDRESLYTALKKYAGEAAFDADIISADATQTCIFLVCGKKDAAALKEALRRLNFAAPPVTGMNPKDSAAKIDRELEKAESELTTIHDKFQELAKFRDDLKFMSDYFTVRADKYGVISDLLQSRRVFFLEGYIPEPDAGSVQQRLEAKFDVAVTFSEPGKKEKPPILLKNNGFAAPLEGVTESYSMPDKGEIDPTFVSACFYYILFGMMLSDAAYGIILAVATGIILAKFGKKMEDGMKKTMKMFFFCGLSTTFWGFMFGSFFGDAVSVIATTFFNRPDIALKPLWFEPINEPMRMLSFCFLVALIHMFVGVGVKGYQQLKAGQVLDFIYDCVFWWVFIIALIVWLLSVPSMAGMLQLKTLPQAVVKPAQILALISAIGIILTGGRESKNWFKRILKGLYALYGISSWLSDVLSYSRLLALGLATGVIATVFNSMGSMGGRTPAGVIMFIVVFLIGNVLNLAINALGAYVHTNRLTYVEFFGKFYNGGGKKFVPFAANTKYYKFKEDMES